MLLFNDIFPKEITGFISGRDVDFRLDDKDAPLTSIQKAYLSRACGWPPNILFNIRQMHGDGVVIATRDTAGKQPPFPKADAVITNEYGLPIVVRTADCLSIFIHDPLKRCIGLIHAGWRGTEKEIAVRTIQAMREEWDCRPGDMTVVLGPCIHKDSYEVSVAFKEKFPQETEERGGKFYFDLALANRNQLRRLDVPDHQIHDCGIDTFSDPRYFSYRRQGRKAGRHLSLISNHSG